jgi:hypothetical protein
MVRRMNGIFNRSNEMAIHPGQSVRARDGAIYVVACIAHGRVWAYSPEGLRAIAVAGEDECEQGHPALPGGPHSPCPAHIAPQGLDCARAA